MRPIIIEYGRNLKMRYDQSKIEQHFQWIAMENDQFYQADDVCAAAIDNFG